MMISAARMIFFLLMMAMTIPCYLGGLNSGLSNNQLSSAKEDGNTTLTLNSEQANLPKGKLLIKETCTHRDISISQSQDTTSGLPSFIVEIVNTCLNSTCAPSNIHVHCGVFASATFVNPTLFRRLAYDDCLVHQGKPLETSHTIRFTYSNNFKYQIRFKSAKFC